AALRPSASRRKEIASLLLLRPVMESPSTGNSSPLNAGHASAAAANIDASAPAPLLSAEDTVEARYLHPDAKALFSVVPFMRFIPHFGIASEAFGPKCVFSLGLSEFLCKGIAD
ncbi:folate/pteridine transporter, partial [Trypanosoma grayi]|uniref:folate/pteridine transporter n=1 Tax=Trypanosoma grayi TaxID=71804 RepID=UPI0004F4346C